MYKEKNNSAHLNYLPWKLAVNTKAYIFRACATLENVRYCGDNFPLFWLYLDIICVGDYYLFVWKVFIGFGVVICG